MLQAGAYSATMHYLQAVRAAGTADRGPVMQKMREMPIHDFFARDGHIRSDGLMVHDMYLFQVKTPAQSKGPWDRTSASPPSPVTRPFSRRRNRAARWSRNKPRRTRSGGPWRALGFLRGAQVPIDGSGQQRQLPLPPA